MHALYLCKRDNYYADRAAEYLKLNFKADIIKHNRGEKIHRDSLRNKYDYIISFLYPNMLKEDTLCRTEKAINFHPGPPSYPGIGCTNFAIYNDECQYGVTCHYIDDKIDHGEIIDVSYFKVNNETVWSLTQKCYSYLLTMFYNIVDKILLDIPLPSCGEKWTREPYTRADLNALCKITPAMNDKEIRLRVHATDYPGKPGANVKIGGINFEYRR